MPRILRFRLRDRQKGSSGGWRSKRGTQSAAVTRPTTPESVGVGCHLITQKKLISFFQVAFFGTKIFQKDQHIVHGPQVFASGPLNERKAEF